MRRTTWALAALMLGPLASGCGKSKQQEILDQLAAECSGLVTSHATFAQADIDFRGAYPVLGPDCRPDLLPLPANDTCAPASAAAEVCRVQYWYDANDPALCSAGRCWYVCEVRLEKPALDAEGMSAPVCASIWYPNAS